MRFGQNVYRVCKKKLPWAVGSSPLCRHYISRSMCPESPSPEKFLDPPMTSQCIQHMTSQCIQHMTSQCIQHFSLHHSFACLTIRSFKNKKHNQLCTDENQAVLVIKHETGKNRKWNLVREYEPGRLELAAIFLFTLCSVDPSTF